MTGDSEDNPSQDPGRWVVLGQFVAGLVKCEVGHLVDRPDDLQAVLQIPLRLKEDGTPEYLPLILTAETMALLSVMTTKVANAMVPGTIFKKEG